MKYLSCLCVITGSVALFGCAPAVTEPSFTPSAELPRFQSIATLSGGRSRYARLFYDREIDQCILITIGDSPRMLPWPCEGLRAPQ